MKVATGTDGKINVLPNNQDLFILFYNKELLAAKGFTAPPKDYDELMTMAHALTDPSKQIYGFVGRGLKNANVVLYDNILLGWDQETVTAGRQETADRHARRGRGRGMVPEDHEGMRAARKHRLQLERMPDDLHAGPRGDVVGRHRLLRAAAGQGQVRRSSTRSASRRCPPDPRHTTAPPSSRASASPPRPPQRTRRPPGCSCNGSAGKDDAGRGPSHRLRHPSPAVGLRSARTSPPTAASRRSGSRPRAPA